MDTIKEAARSYWEQGLAVVPVEGKKPLCKWAKWQSKPQTLEEFESLPWDKADGFGVLCGLKGKNGLYLAVIDVDKADADFNLALLQTTQIEKTPSGGYHYIYWSRQPVEAEKRIDLKVELLGLGNICIIAPSKGYVRLNDNQPTEVDSAKALFNQLVVKLGGKPEREIVDVKRLLKGVKVGERDNAAIRLATWYRKKGLNPEETLKKLGEWDKRNVKPLGLKTLKEKVKSAFKLSEPYSWVFSEKPERRKIKHVPFIELPDGRLAEQGYDGEKTYFLVYNPAEGQVEKMDEIETENWVFRPIKNSDVENFLTLLPSQVEEYESEERLFHEVVEFMNRWHEAPNERERKLDALYVFLTYSYDLLPRIPYRRALGSYGRGKSAWLETIGSICYRPLILAGCDTDKAIVRRINFWRGTALIDEADFSSSSLYAFIIKILNIGYDRKLGYYQRADDVNPSKTISYNVYGPKILATRREFKDKALESRCLTFIAREKTRPMPLYRDKKFMEEAQVLRNKLVLWRFRTYHKLKENVEVLETPQIDLELLSSSRVKEVLTPLLLLNPDFKTEIQKLAEELESQLRVGDPDWELEEALKDAILKICDSEQGEGGEGNEGLLGAPGEKELFILRIPLTKIAKVILDNPNPDTDTLKGLNQRLSKIARTRLGLKIVAAGKRKPRCIELPYPLHLKPPPPSQPSPYKIIELDDKHPLEKQRPVAVRLTESSVEEPSPEEAEKRLKVWNALAEANLLRGSAFLDEIVQAAGLPVAEVKAILEQFQRNGKIYSPYMDVWKVILPEKVSVKAVHWARATLQVTSLDSWKAIENSRWLRRRGLHLEFPDSTKVKVTGALTWFIAKLKAFELFGEWRKKQNLTRDSTVPGCIGYGRPIPPNTCETCHLHGDYTCIQLKQRKRAYCKTRGARKR